MARSTAVFNNLSNVFLALKILPSECLIVLFYRCVISASGQGPGPGCRLSCMETCARCQGPCGQSFPGAASLPGADSQHFLKECGIRNAVSLAQERESLSTVLCWSSLHLGRYYWSVSDILAECSPSEEVWRKCENKYTGGLPRPNNFLSEMPKLKHASILSVWGKMASRINIAS